MPDFKAKMHQNPKKSAGAPPQTPLGSLQRSPDPLAGFKGPTSKGWGAEGMGSEEGTGGEGREGSVVESKKILKIDHDVFANC